MIFSNPSVFQWSPCVLELYNSIVMLGVFCFFSFYMFTVKILFCYRLHAFHISLFYSFLFPSLQRSFGLFNINNAVFLRRNCYDTLRNVCVPRNPRIVSLLGKHGAVKYCFPARGHFSQSEFHHGRVRQ